MQPVELALVIPTLNERDNVRPLLAELETALRGIAWEVIFVDDDSVDGTAQLVAQIAQHDPRVRLLRRVGRRGLASAAIEGMLASTAPYIGVIDADLQHDPKILPEMLAALRHDEIDLVIGSRYAEGGGLGDWSERRRRISRIASRMGTFVLGRQVSDPMSGFFLLRRGLFESTVHALSGIGFKILLDLLASAPADTRVAEVPYVFRERHLGTSKLDRVAVWEYVTLVLDKLVGQFVPPRLIFFGMVGTVGLLVHLAVLWAAYDVANWSFAAAQTIATMIAMLSNFFLNNSITFLDRRIRGNRLIAGLLLFCIVCSFGALADVGAAEYLYTANETWWVAGLAGGVISLIWNYALSSTVVWPARPLRRRRAAVLSRKAETLVPN